MWPYFYWSKNATTKKAGCRRFQHKHNGNRLFTFWDTSWKFIVKKFISMYFHLHCGPYIRFANKTFLLRHFHYAVSMMQVGPCIWCYQDHHCSNVLNVIRTNCLNNQANGWTQSVFNRKLLSQALVSTFSAGIHAEPGSHMMAYNLNT